MESRKVARGSLSTSFQCTIVALFCVKITLRKSDLTALAISDAEDLF